MLRHEASSSAPLLGGEAMLSRRTEAEVFFAQQRSPVLVPGLIALVAVSEVASVVFTLMTA